MMVGTLNTFFHDQIKRAIAAAKVPSVVTEDNVFQEADPNILPLLDEMVEALALPGSGLDGLENLEELLAKAESGKSCLILTEHYSNLDLSIISLMTRKAGGRGDDINNSLIAIAGMKLNEDNRAIAAFAGAYSRIVIYPSRTLQDLDPDKNKAEILRGNAINRAAMKAIIRNKYKGKLILVFPSGTRYRPWDPESKKGVRDIDAYIRSFDYMCFVALNGQIMGVEKSNMINDAVYRDLVRVTVSPVFSCDEFRNKTITAAGGDEDKKQAVADEIMNELEKMHITAEAERIKLVKE